MLMWRLGFLLSPLAPRHTSVLVMVPLCQPSGFSQKTRTRDPAGYGSGGSIGVTAWDGAARVESMGDASADSLGGSRVESALDSSVR